MLTYQFFTNLARDPEYNYNLKKTLQLIIQSKHNKSSRISQKKRLELFYHMHQIIIMHIDIYSSMCSRDFDHSDSNSAFQRDDLISEFYIIFERCVNNYDLAMRDKKGKRINFYFYFKKSLMWGVQRLYHLQKKKYQNVDLIGWDNDWKYDTRASEDILDFDEFLMNQWGFDKLQQDIVQAKIEGIPIKEFIVKMNITSNDYYRSLQEIKDKLHKLWYEGNLLHNQHIDPKWIQHFGDGGIQRRNVILAGQRVPRASSK